MSILEKDSDIQFPHFTVLKASAGSGKTYALTERLVQFLLSEKIPHNHLRNILAITFSNNASKEMKERALEWLKSLYFEDHEAVEELSRILSVKRPLLVEKAGKAVDTILRHFADFQVRTIDSFMAAIFRSSAIDFGYGPDFEILLDSDPLLEYAFNLYQKEVKEGTPQAQLLGKTIRIIVENRKKGDSYLWDPSADLLEEIRKIHKRLGVAGDEGRIEDHSRGVDRLKQKIQETLERLESMIVESGLERNNNSSFPDLLAIAGEARFSDLLEKGLKTPPVKKPPKSKSHLQAAYGAICDEWGKATDAIREYIASYARSYYTPYLRLHEILQGTIEEVKKRQGKVFIEDINKRLGDYLRSEIVPDIYCRIGETVFHFLIDEFQDTSPIQWKNLFPLVENALAQGGSLFVVGDTKQAIYAFRDADYTIMKTCEEGSPFPSAQHQVLDLETNYRSLPRVLEFNERVFKENVRAMDEYRLAAEQSGLTSYIQKAKEGWRQSGTVQVELIDGDSEDLPERSRLQEILRELEERGCRYHDIAILTAKNEEVVKVTTWLSEKDVPFISYSSLDIRRRKVTGEVISLLRFLDSPPDDLSFATFLSGEIFSRSLQSGPARMTTEQLHQFLFRNRRNSPLYKAFQEELGDLWERQFSRLFRSVGYLPLYDLVTEIFRLFRVFETHEEDEAVLTKILEAVKDFEGSGSNSLRDFIVYAGEEKAGGPAWEIDVPRNVNAVRVMTIHKAKGLGFPVVVLLLYGTSSRGFDYIVDREGKEVTLLKLNRKITEAVPQFKERYDEEVLKETVNRLNSLYVGFTRAKEELYVIGVQGKRDFRPLDLLPVGEYTPAAKPPRIHAGPAEIERLSPLYHSTEPLQFYAGSEGQGTLSSEERRRGELVHGVLSSIEFAGEDVEDRLAQAIQRFSGEMRTEHDPQEIRRIILEIMEHPEIKDFFIPKPGREIRREQECVDDEGSLFRMDRLVIDPDRITVIDWKTGMEKETEEHQTQMRNYLRILEGIYPGKIVEGLLAYVDLKEVKRIP